MTQNPSPDVVRPSMYTKKSRPLRHRFVRCWWWWEWRLEYTEYKHQYKPAYNSYRFHSFPLLPCLNWGHSSKACRSFHQRAFDAATAPSWYADLLGIWRWGSLKAVLALKGAVKFRTFLCLHRIRGFRPPKSMETSWKWSKCSNRRCSSGNRQPHWMHSMTAHTQGILWKMIEPRSRGWLCCSLTWKPKIPLFLLVMAKSR